MLDRYADFEYLLAQIQLVLFMLGMGATLLPRDFVAVVRRPGFFLIGAAFQFLVTPAFALLLNRWWDLEAGVAVGLVLVSAMPGGQMSKLFTYAARGNVALSIALSAFGTLISVVTVPLLLHLLARDLLGENALEMPVGKVVLDVSLFLVAPLLAGMALGRWQPRHRVRFSRACIRIGLVFVVVMVAGSLASGRIQPAAHGWKTPLAIVVFCVGVMQLSLLPFRLLGSSKRDAVAVGIEVTMRNMNLALLLKALLFPASDEVGNGVLFVVLFYGATAMVAGVPLTLRYRMQLRPSEPTTHATSRKRVAT